MKKSLLKDKIDHILTNGHTFHNDSILKQRIVTLNLIGIILIIAVIILGLANVYIYDNTTFGMLHFIGAAVGLFFLVFQRFLKPQLALNLGIALLILIILVLTYPDGIASSHTFWLYLVPIYAFFMAGISGGIVWSTITFIIAMIYIALPYAGLHDSPVNLQVILDFSLSYILVSIFAYWYEKLRVQFVDQLSNKNDQLQRLVYTVSHDLKTPIVSLLGYIEFIKEEIVSGDDTQRDEDIGKMEQIIKNMQQMIADLLNLSRVKRDGRYTMVSTGDIVVRLLEETEPQTREKNIVTHMDGRFPTISTDERKLEEIFRNLLSNAIKYIGNPPQPEITIGVQDKQKEFYFFVKDNGIGIDPQERKNIFQPFYSKSDISIGSGIGLSIVKGFVEDMAGRVWVESQKGRGSTFWFALPKTQKDH